jgi:TolA-binding protein
MSRLAWFARGRRACPAAWKLTRFASSGAPDPEIERHLASCAKCAARSRALDAIVVEVSHLPAPPGMSDESRAQIAARLLAAPPRSAPAKAPALRLRVTTAAAVAAVAAAFAVALGALVVRERAGTPAQTTASQSTFATPATPATPAAPLSPPALSRASIRAIGDARFARVQPPPEEIVRLDEGRIELDVVPLAPGERFRVVTGNGEVEVRGTSFEVLAADHRLVAVSVSRGRVEVRSGGGGLAVLDAGDRWEQGPTPDPAAAAPTAPQLPLADAAPARTGPGRRHRASQRPSAIESALFHSGWESLRAGNARDAAETFAELERRAQGRGIQEDALYWRAVATARCKESANAGRLFQEFLAKFPRSARRGEAAVALGWILVDAGEVGEARRAFQQAASDPAASVRGSAAEGIRRTTRP